MARRRKHEDHVNHEAWAIPYGDLITLLLAFFVVMYSMSSVNEGKYRILSDSLIAAFRGAPSTVAPITVGRPASGQGGDAQLTAVSPTSLLKLRDARPLPEVEDAAPRRGQPGAGPGPGRGGGHPEQEALYRMADEVRRALQGLIDRELVRVRHSALALEVEIKADILFPSGVAQVDRAAEPVIERVAEILRPFPNHVRVEGHTDDRPIRTAAFPSNWELSAARAANVVHLFTRAGVDPLRLEVLGLGEHRPLRPNDTVEGRNANRRVVIVVLQSPPVGSGTPAPEMEPGPPPAAPGPQRAGAPDALAASGSTGAAPPMAGAALPTGGAAPGAAAPAGAAAPPSAAEAVLAAAVDAAARRTQED